MQFRKPMNFRDAIRLVREKKVREAQRMIRGNAGGTVSGFPTGFASPLQAKLNAAIEEKYGQDQQQSKEFWENLAPYVEEHRGAVENLILEALMEA